MKGKKSGCLLLVLVFLFGLLSAAVADETARAVVSFVGDCSVGDAYDVIGFEKSYHSVIQREGAEWPFSLVREYLTSDDLTVANLEVVLTERRAKKDVRHPLRGKPEHVNVLTAGGIEAVNTVNNHCMDYQEDGYNDTLSVLDAAGIGHFGSVNYRKPEGHDDLLVRDVNGIRFGFVGMFYPHETDMKPLQERIRILKEDEGCDVVVVSLHWGRETHHETESSQRSIALQMIDTGADVIYGHHPHVLQPLTFYRGKPIMFSTGNFTFGAMGDMDHYTGIFRGTWEKSNGRTVLREFRVIPCWYNGTDDYRPFELTEEGEREKVFRFLVYKRGYARCVNPPESFLRTGVIRFDENGDMISDE